MNISIYVTDDQLSVLQKKNELSNKETPTKIEDFITSLVQDYLNSLIMEENKKVMDEVKDTISANLAKLTSDDLVVAQSFADKLKGK